MALIALTLIGWISMPLPARFTDHADHSGVTILDRNGLVLRSTRADDGSRASWVSYDAIDPDLINAFVAVEDRRFWEHHGVDVRALARAAVQDVRARRVVSGASTITMQLARLLKPSDSRWLGKPGQVLWALRLERHLSKQQIMEQYLNRVHLGEATVGVGAAALLYFATSASSVSLGQAATLAGIAHAPSRDNPFASASRASQRRRVAVGRMRRAGYVVTPDAQRALAEPLLTAPSGAPFLAPHFTAHVLASLGDSATTSGTIQTTLNLGLQQQVEAEVRHTVDVMHDRNVQQAAAVVLDNATGDVLAWVGSPDFWAAKDGQTDMVTSPRQPGSALKPFLYALALDRGFTAATVLPDVPKTYATTTGAYSPRNYDRQFHGPVRVREALASSYNVPAIEVASRVGTGSFLNELHLAGFASLDHDAEYYGLGLALGNGDVSLIELANAYRGLANGGEWKPFAITLSEAKGLLDRRDGSRRFTSRISAAITLDILSDPVARMPGFGDVTPFDFPFPTAVKTGTSRHFTDNWAVAATGTFTVAVWAGNFDGHPMQGVSGVTGAGPLLHRIVMIAASRFGAGVLPTPQGAGARAEPVCRLSGMRATPACEQLTEWFAPGTEPRAYDTWQSGGHVTLPPEYADWGGRSKLIAATPAIAAHVPAHDTSTFAIVSPRDGDRYAMPVGVDPRYATIALRSTASRVHWRVDGRPYARERWPLSPGTHEIVAVTQRGDSAAARIVVER